MTEGLPLEVTDELGVVARVACTSTPAGVEVRPETPRLVLTRPEAAQVLAAIEAETTGVPSVVLVSNDAVLREAARTAGYHGGLRADLVRDVGPRPHVPRTVAEWLPDAQVTERVASAPRRLTRFVTTGLDRMARVEAHHGGVTAAVVVPIGHDTLLEPVAATVDTLLDLTARSAQRRCTSHRSRSRSTAPVSRTAASPAPTPVPGSSSARSTSTPARSPAYGAASMWRHTAAGARRPGEHRFHVERTVVHEVGSLGRPGAGSGV